MKNRYYLFFIVVLFSLEGCDSGKNFFSNNVKIIDEKLEISHTLSGELIFADSVCSISSLVCFDDYLLVFSRNEKQVFNVMTYDGQILSQFGTFGRANDELSTSQFNGQVQKISGDNCLWVSDVNKARMVLINVDQSMKQGRFVMLKEIPIPPLSVYCYCVGDSVYINEQLIGSNYELQMRDAALNNVFSETLYSVDTDRAFSLYKTNWRLDSQRNRMIGSMFSVNQINIYSLSDHARQSIIIGDQQTDMKKLINAETGTERTSTFADLELADTGIYALYINQNFDDAYEKEKPQDLLIFDWEGNLVQTVRLNEYIIDFTISRDGKHLFGRARGNKIYHYAL